MDYRSAKETAAAWGLDPSRVTILAKAGRIPGARQMGREWLIPNDAPKPPDLRRKAAAPDAEEVFFPVFLYQFHGSDQDRSKLRPEQQRLYDVQKLYVCGELERAAEILDAIIAETKQRYTLIGALVTRGFVSIELQQTVRYAACLQKLGSIFSEDFPLKNELIYFYYDIASYANGSEQWAADFRIRPAYSFRADAGSYLVTNVAYTALINLALHETPVDPSLLELTCIGFDDRGVFFAAQMVHIFLAGIYLLQGQEAFCKLHVLKVLDVAVLHNSYYPLAIASKYLGPIYDEILPDFPQEVSEKVRFRSSRFQAGVSAIYAYFAKRTDLLKLTERDYEYIMFAIQKKKNREIAHLKGISEPTVSKYYARLYEKVDVYSKKELVEHFRFSILTH